MKRIIKLLSVHKNCNYELVRNSLNKHNMSFSCSSCHVYESWKTEKHNNYCECGHWKTEHDMDGTIISEKSLCSMCTCLEYKEVIG